MTASPSLRNHASSSVVGFGLDGTRLEGELASSQRAYVARVTVWQVGH